MGIGRIWKWHAVAAVLFSLLTGQPALAEGFCAVSGKSAVLQQLSGVWSRDGALSVFNEVTDLREPSRSFQVEIAEDGTFTSPFIDSLTGQGLTLTALETPAYDVDRVDDVLDTTERADLADILSDTRCGPADLPQFQGRIDIQAELQVSGTVTLIAYFRDRVLQITELQMSSEETVLFMTETVLLSPAVSD